MRENTIEELVKIAVKWNRREITDREAMNEIWELLWKDPDNELKDEWNRRNM